MSMRDDPERGPADYDEREDTIRLLVSIIRKQTEGQGGGNYSEGGGDKLLKWVLGVLAILTASAVVGGITIYGKVSSLEATVNAGLNAHEQRIDRLERATER